MIKAVIFDFDGLIIDTELPEYQSWQEIFQGYGCDLPVPVWSVCIGTSFSGFDPHEYLEDQLGRSVDRGRILERHHERKMQLVERREALPGVRDYLDAAQGLGLGIGLASSSRLDWVEPQLSRLGLRHYFEAIRTRDDVEMTKPHPALYRRALEDLGVAPGEAVALEDSPNGALAARRAGIFCVAVPNELTGQLDIEAADMKLTSLEELPLKELIGRIESPAQALAEKRGDRR